MRNKQFKLIVMLLVCLASPLFSENESAKVNPFVRKVVGAGQVIDVIQTRDGNYVSLSRVRDADFLIRKVTLSGSRVWERSLSFQLASGAFVKLSRIAQTTDGYVLAGSGA